MNRLNVITRPSQALRAANDNLQPVITMPLLPTLVPTPISVPDDDDDGPGKGWLALLLLVSLGAHAGVFFQLGPGHRNLPARARRPPAEVTVSIATPPPPPAPAAPPKPTASKLAAPRRIALHAPPPSPTKVAAPPPEAETPADFSGTTLTNQGPGPGWASATGNGHAMQGPIGKPGSVVSGRARDGALGGGSGPAAAPVVPLGSLSRAPAPPDLNAALERHYPEPARRQGTPGQAVLKARITPDGQVRDLVVVSQSAPGFGEACRATLRESVWSAPLDRQGHAVATFVTYTCRFEVR
ncbi:MAG: TonB family protein [Polyangia bacterium]